MLKLIVSQSNNPYFNIAAEDYFLRETDDEYIFLYLNQSSIIVGKHQNALAEINIPWVLNHNIPVVRRLSGGGTVFHDMGNVNFCFIRKGREGKLADMKGFAQPVIQFLQELGLDAFLGEKNDIRLPQGKVSGNAEHVFRQRVMHHGTLLFSANIHSLEESIRVNSFRFIDKAVKSNRSNVTNISYHLANALSVTEFTDKLVSFLSTSFSDIQEYNIQHAEEKRIEELIETRYNRWEWNYAYSPDFEVRFNFEKIFPSVVGVNKGIIQFVKIAEREELSEFYTDRLKGVRFFPREIIRCCNQPEFVHLEDALFPSV